MRTGSVVRPNSLSTVDSGFGFFFGFFFGGGGRAVVVQQQGFCVRGLFVNRHAHVVEHGDHDFQCFRVDQFVGQVVGNFAVCQVAPCFTELDQGLQAQAALGHVFFGQHGFVQAEFLHQGAFLGLADLHAQRFDLFASGDLRFTHQIGFDVRHIHVIARFGAGTGGGLGLAAPLGAGFGGRVGFCSGGLGRATGLFLGNDFAVFCSRCGSLGLRLLLGLGAGGRGFGGGRR